MTFLCAMTVGILFLQIVIISKLDNHYKDIISSEVFISERIDVITSNIHELRNMLQNANSGK